MSESQSLIKWKLYCIISIQLDFSQENHTINLAHSDAK